MKPIKEFLSLVPSTLLWWAGVGNDRSSAICMYPEFYKSYEHGTRNSRKIVSRPITSQLVRSPTTVLCYDITCVY